MVDVRNHNSCCRMCLGCCSSDDPKMKADVGTANDSGSAASTAAVNLLEMTICNIFSRQGRQSARFFLKIRKVQCCCNVFFRGRIRMCAMGFV